MGGDLGSLALLVNLISVKSGSQVHLSEQLCYNRYCSFFIRRVKPFSDTQRVRRSKFSLEFSVTFFISISLNLSICLLAFLYRVS